MGKFRRLIPLSYCVFYSYRIQSCQDLIFDVVSVILG